MHRAVLALWAGLWWTTVLGNGSALRGADGNPPQHAAKLGIPSDDDQQHAAQLVSSLFKTQIDGAKTKEQKTAVAQQMLRVGRETHDDAPGRYVLFCSARDVALGGGDLETALVAVDALAEFYAVDALLMKVDLLGKLSKLPVPKKESETQHQAFQQTIREAMLLDRYDVARNLNGLLLASAQRVGNTELVKQASLLNKPLLEIEAEHAKTRAALQTLAAQPDDPAASWQVGKFHCFMKGDWAQGLPWLMRGSDPPLKALASRELADAPDPLALGDQWWDIAQSQQGRAQEQVQAHAAEWYRKTSGLTGITKIRVESRLASASAAETVSPLGSLARPAQVAGNGNSSAATRATTSAGKTPPAVAGAKVNVQKLRQQYAPDAMKVGDHYYKIFPKAVTWTEARDACAKMGGCLVCFDTPQERSKVSAVNDLGPLWVGCYVNDQGQAVWLNGRPHDRDLKQTSEDDGYVVLTRSHMYQARPLDGSQRGSLAVQGYICEWNE